jgi:hypothetical protein
MMHDNFLGTIALKHEIDRSRFGDGERAQVPTGSWGAHGFP